MLMTHEFQLIVLEMQIHFKIVMIKCHFTGTDLPS